ncbi:MAG: NAD kinase [Bacteroidia bacterium]|nr:NAD kinase [Bacteroidia bacterium]
MKIAIFGRFTDNTDPQILIQFFSFLKTKNIDFLLYEKYMHQLHEKLNPELLPKDMPIFSKREELSHCRFVYCFGGDGTVLEAVKFMGNVRKPILGVNFGRLGYLTSISQRELIPATEELARDMYRFDERSLITVVSDPPGIFGAKPYGINDLTIHKSKTNEMITVHTYLNGEFLNSYWGDGLIVATPTGSTAYSLSCGGPIIFPSSAALVITPIASHSLTVRPVVIPDDWVVSFEIESRSGEAMIALDTRTELVSTNTSIAVKKATFQVTLLRMSTTKYVDNLRRSLMWGSDNRN